MTKQTDSVIGNRRLLRRTLVFTLGLSVAANVGHTLLADSVIPAWLRMIGAVAWPVLVFLGVDIVVKVAWDSISGRRAGVHLARLLILVPGTPAAITSYEHMHAVLLAMGEKPFIAAIGPGAVDLMMIGCTITLVFLNRAPHEIEAQTPPRTPKTPNGNVITFDHDLSESEVAEFKRATFYTPPAETVERKPRAAKADQAKAIALLLEGKPDEAVAAGLMSRATMATYAKVARLLQADSAVEIGQKVNGRSVNAELVKLIRADARKAQA